MTANYLTSIDRALEIDAVIQEIAEAMRWVRKRKGLASRDQVVESAVVRRLALGCVKRLHMDLHMTDGPTGKRNYMFPHTNPAECRDELLRLCQKLRYTDIETLHSMGRENSHHFPHYDHDVVIEGDA